MFHGEGDDPDIRGPIEGIDRQRRREEFLDFGCTDRPVQKQQIAPGLVPDDLLIGSLCRCDAVDVHSGPRDNDIFAHRSRQHDRRLIWNTQKRVGLCGCRGFFCVFVLHRKRRLLSIDGECLIEELCLLEVVAGFGACSRTGGFGARNATERVVCISTETIEHLATQEWPCTHVLGFFLDPNEWCSLGVLGQDFVESGLWEGIILFESVDRHVFQAAFFAFLEQVVIDLTATEQDALDLGSVDACVLIGDESLELSGGQFFDVGDCEFVAKQALG